MSLRSSRPRAGDTASQLWAHSLDAGELIDMLDVSNQAAFAALARDFFGQNGQLLRIVDNHLAKWNTYPTSDAVRHRPTVQCYASTASVLT